MRRMQIIAGLILAGIVIVAMSSCTRMGVKAWERDIMAKPSMQFDADAVDQALDDHIYFSKEASSGGRSFGGGGCGCN